MAGLEHKDEPRSKAALLLIDVINDLDFPEAEQLLELAEPMAPRLAGLAERARNAGLPVIYVNDNFGQWRSDFRAVVEHCKRAESRGRHVVSQLEPRDEDYFVLKPMHSGFYSTTLDTLLEHLNIETVVLTGIATNICVLFTANDAYMRKLRVAVISDCTAANTRDLHEYALDQMGSVLKADVVEASELGSQQLQQLLESGQFDR